MSNYALRTAHAVAFSSTTNPCRSGMIAGKHILLSVSVMNSPVPRRTQRRQFQSNAARTKRKCVLLQHTQLTHPNFITASSFHLPDTGEALVSKLRTCRNRMESTPEALTTAMRGTTNCRPDCLCLFSTGQETSLARATKITRLDGQHADQCPA
jgi:hypothetical protein